MVECLHFQIRWGIWLVIEAVWRHEMKSDHQSLVSDSHTHFLSLLGFFAYLESSSVVQSTSVYLWTPFMAHWWEDWYGCPLRFLTTHYKKIFSWSKINQTLSSSFYHNWRNIKTDMTREPEEVNRKDSIYFCFLKFLEYLWFFWSPVVCFSLISSVLWSVD